jgi:hypothetical protein
LFYFISHFSTADTTGALDVLELSSRVSALPTSMGLMAALTILPTIFLIPSTQCSPLMPFIFKECVLHIFFIYDVKLHWTNAVDVT